MIDGPRMAPASGGPARSLVILLHGYGSNGDDLIGLVPHWRGALPDTAFVSPNAPERCPGAPGGYQWWALTGGDRAAGAASAAPVLDAFIDAELARHGLDDASLALVGFSQGTMMALQVGPRRAGPLAGIVGYSGMLADEAALAAPGDELLREDRERHPPDEVVEDRGREDDQAEVGLHQAQVEQGLGQRIDVGTGDGIPQAAKPEYLDQSTANKFRTAPLWGLRFRQGLMHDGDSPGIEAAIKRHGGEATMIRQRYEHLTVEQKNQLQAFLSSL